MPWVKFPNYMNNLRKLRSALQVARTLEPRELANDEIYGYALLDAGVITSRSSVAELKQKPRADQGPITNGRGLPEMFQLLGMMVRDGDRIHLTETGNRVADAEGETITDDELDLWRASVLNLRFPHDAFPEKSSGVDFRPAHVMISMLELGPLPGQGLAFAFAVANESPSEIERARTLAAQWTDTQSQQLANAASVTASELRNNAKVFPGLLEQIGLIRRSGGWAYVTTEGLEALGVGRRSSPSPEASSASARKIRSRPIDGKGPASWSPEPIDPEDAAERAYLRLLKIERANAAHEMALRLLNDWLVGHGFATAQADYDILASRDSLEILVEVKSLSATNARRQTVSAIGQLAYYYNGLAKEAQGPRTIARVAFFDREPADPQIHSVLEQEGIEMGWINDDGDVVLTNADFYAVLVGENPVSSGSE